MSSFPKGWCPIMLSDLLLRIEAGLNVKCIERPPTPIERGLVKISAVTWGKFDELQTKTLPSDVALDERNRIKVGDLLISRANTLDLVGASVIVENINLQLYLSDKVLRLVVPDVVRRWINYALKTPSLRRAIAESSSGNQLSMRNISQEKLRSLPLLLAPQAEISRITEKLDTILTRVDSVNSRLDRITPLLKRFRQSVLAAATSGRLTADWRLTNELSGVWRNKKLNELGSIGRGKSKHRPRNDPVLYGGPYPFLQTGDIANAKQWIMTHGQTYSEFGLAQSKIWPRETLCVTIAANIADTALLSYPACFPDSVVGFVANPDVCKSMFVKYFIDVCKNDLERLAPATAQKNINLGILEQVSIPTPPLIEQVEIIRRVEILFAFADRLEARLQAAHNSVARLTPSLLAKAFRGELVPQDPADEPVGDLLKRLAGVRLEGSAGKKNQQVRSTQRVL